MIRLSLPSKLIILFGVLLIDLNFSIGSVLKYKRQSDDYVEITTDQRIIEKYYGDRVELRCVSRTNSNDLEIVWLNPKREMIYDNEKYSISTYIQNQENPLTKDSTLVINRLDSDDLGRYECRATSGNLNKEIVIDLNLSQPDSPSAAPCEIDEATCKNGQCIPRAGLCDGRTDCTDGSDESSCRPIHGIGKCEPNERACRNGHCLQKIWYCDGENDCEDGSDETECAALTTSGSCKSHEFECKSQNQCVIKSFVCDKEFDCQDQSDEMGCEPPRIVQFPTRNLTITLGSTFIVECKAVGFPSPFINWRLNWGHTCEEPRCYSTNSNGYGTFTVTDTQFIDAGAYSCEAINAIGRIFAVPDTIVTVIPGRPVTPPPTRPVYIPPPPPQIEDFDCKCNGHSEDCTCKGYCLNCRDNTDGPDCGSCKPGYTGSGKYGDVCVPLSAPFQKPTIKTTRTTTTRRPTTTRIQPVEDDDCWKNCNNHTDMCTCSNICRFCMHNTENGPFNQCEKCKLGYDGDSFDPRGCFKCAYGFSGFENPEGCQPNNRTFINCNCNGHATQCTSSGLCLNCQRNTEGDYCERCKPGFVGDPRSNGCVFPSYSYSCNCNGHSTECTSNGYCLNCQDNTEGANCERCRQGFVGDARILDGCYPIVAQFNKNQKMSDSTCNELGTAHNLENSCKCKTGVTGQSCDQCKPRYFNLAANNKKGCLSCFCNGLSVECKSSDLYYRKEISDFANEDWYLSNKYTQLKEDVQLVQNGVQYNRINQHQNEDLYFIVSSKFKGNHLLSYDGDLSFKFKFELPESSNENIEQLEIRISGSSINIVHVVSHNLLPNIENEINVKLNENSFMRYGDNNKIEREFLLMALADIDLIMIKAKLSNEQSSASISNFSIETADGKDTNQRLAFAVEVCTCPPGYTGTSCELCTSGFKRSGQGFYWGFCEPI